MSASLKKSLSAAYHEDKVSSINWGITHENVAVACYCEYGAEVSPTGKSLVDSVIEFGYVYNMCLLVFLAV